MPYGGAIGADPYLDRAGIHCRTVEDAARVLDALKDPECGYFDPRDIHGVAEGADCTTAVCVVCGPARVRRGSRASRQGMRIGIVREYGEHAANDAMSDQSTGNQEGPRDRLGASSWNRSIRCIRTIRRFRT